MLIICTFLRIYKFSRSRSDLQNLPIFNWSPQRWIEFTSNHIFKKEKKKEQKNVKRKDRVTKEYVNEQRSRLVFPRIHETVRQ